jgi:nucleotide-binding universal stress UspA family protein
VHVAETAWTENVTYGDIAQQREPTSYAQRLETDLRTSVPPPAGVSARYIVAEGDPATEITRVAGEERCDLIVMATHARTGLSRLFTSSVAEHLIRLAPCPVLIAKLPEPQPG